jgi:branched-chain amino acid transport system ATP-binding protein
MNSIVSACDSLLRRIFMVASLALEIAHEAYVLQTGRIALSGPARALKDDPRVRDAYLGGMEAA